MRPLVIVLLAAAGCSASSPLEARLRECGYVGEGEVGPWTFAAFYAPDRCYEDCLVRGSCEELAGSICRDDLSLVLGCDEECAYRCDDGALIGLERVCSGFPDCVGGEDERGCAPVPSPEEHRCGDGGTAWAWQLCDGRADCEDATDERDCHHVACGTDDEIVRRLDQPSPRCNGWPECPDGSDERGCALLVVTCP